jgi:hypothetical protein
VKKSTQCQRLLDHFNEFGSITTLEAVQEYGILRLASRVHEMRCNGFVIKSEFEHGTNRFGDAVKWKRYRLVKLTQYSLL